MNEEHPGFEQDPDHGKARAFFRRLLEMAPDTKHVNVVMVAHLVDSARPFLPILSEYFNLRAVYAKRNSMSDDVRDYLEREAPDIHIRRLNRQEFRVNPAFFVDEVFEERAGAANASVILVDIGGYFADSQSDQGGPERIRAALHDRGYRLLGIVEDTENGHKRYERWLESRKPADIPVYSVARSPLKKPENHLVGVAVTFSIEAILRQSNIVLQSRRAGVIGFGPIGRSVAHSLRNRGIPVRVCEVDPILLAVAAAQGFHVHHYDDDFISFAHDLNLVVSATGAGASMDQSVVSESVDASIDEILRPSRLDAKRRLPLNASTVRYLEPDTFVASVTSSDDEIDLRSIRERYASQQLVTSNRDVWLYSERQTDRTSAALRAPHGFYLMMDGNAVNFRHSGVIGPAIQLLQGEIIACMQEIANEAGSHQEVSSKKEGHKVRELTRRQRRVVADVWLDQHLVENIQRG